VHDRDQTHLLHALQNYAETVRVESVEPVCRDPEDNLILASSVAGKTNYMLAGDKDLLVLEEHKDVRIVPPLSFCTNWNEDQIRRSERNTIDILKLRVARSWTLPSPRN